jgi:hypothetical protein
MVWNSKQLYVLLLFNIATLTLAEQVAQQTAALRIETWQSDSTRSTGIQ